MYPFYSIFSNALISRVDFASVVLPFLLLGRFFFRQKVTHISCPASMTPALNAIERKEKYIHPKCSRWIKMDYPLSKQNAGVKRHHSSFMLRVFFWNHKMTSKKFRRSTLSTSFLEENGTFHDITTNPLDFSNGLQESAPSRVARAFGRVSDASSTATVSERGMVPFLVGMLTLRLTDKHPKFIQLSDSTMMSCCRCGFRWCQQLNVHEDSAKWASCIRIKGRP